MPAWTVEHWRTLSPYLDEIVGMSPDRRAEWLASIRSRDEALHADLERLIAEYEDLLKSGFLESVLDWPTRTSR